MEERKFELTPFEGIKFWINIPITIAPSPEADNLESALEQMKSLFKIDKSQQRLLLFSGHDYDKSFDEADRLPNEISGGLFESFREHLFNFFCLGYHSPIEEQEAAVLTRRIGRVNTRLTRRIRRVNTRLLTKIPMAPHPPQGGQDKRAGGDLAVDDAYDTWKEGCSYLAVDDFVVGREDAICGVLSDDGKNKDDLKIISIWGMRGIGKTTLARKLVHQDYSVRHHFDCIAWATVGKSFSTRHVLEDLLDYKQRAWKSEAFGDAWKSEGLEI